jgi:hypothetical protein
MSENVPSGLPEIPVQIIEKFISELANAQILEVVVDRLRKTLLVDRTLRESAIRAALSTSDQ